MPETKHKTLVRLHVKLCIYMIFMARKTPPGRTKCSLLVARKMLYTRMHKHTNGVHFGGGEISSYLKHRK